MTRNVKSELIFVRHGTTNSNQNGLLHGRTDIPLDPSGIREAQLAARRILELGGVEQVVTSPLQRAMVTAHEIGAMLGIDPITDPRLIEFDFGDLEGVSFDDLQDKHTALYLSMIDPDGFELPFPNGESRSALHSRVVETLERIPDETPDGGRTVIVAHLIVIATAIAHLTSGDPNDAIRYLVGNASISRLVLDGNGSAELIELNDTTHLQLSPEEEGV